MGGLLGGVVGARNPRRERWSRPPFRLFETVELNALGWAAVLAPGLVVGGLGGLVLSRGWRSSVIGTAVGVCGAVGVAVAVDRRRHRLSFVNYGVDDPDGAAAMLAEAGIKATPGRYPEAEWSYVTVQQRDLDRALKVLEQRPRGH